MKFHTPLHQVFELPYQFVVQNYYEQVISEMSEEDLEPLINKALDPHYNEDEEKEVQDFIHQIEQEEIKKGRLKPKKDPSSAKKPESLSQVASGPSKDPEVVVRKYDEAPPLEADADDFGLKDSPSTPGLLGLDDLDQE